MRRVQVHVVAVSAVVVFGMAGTTAGAAYAFAPAPAPSASAPAAGAPAVPGKEVCTIEDERLVELSGMVATADGYIVINDGSDLASRRRVFFLDKKCDVTDTVQFPRRALDPEDLALSTDRKTLWIGDIGDNDADRETVAVWKMPANGSKQPVIHRLRYPDGAKDAEGLLVGRDGLPIIITKGAKAELFKPTGPLRKDETTPLKKVGELSLPKTSTSTPLGPLGRISVSGAAAAPDGSRVVLRTYADAFEWDVTDGNIVGALTSGTPRITPLPDEPLGEAIAYAPDGKSFVTVSETSQAEDLKPTILRYTPAKEAPKPPAGQAAADKGDTRSWLDKLSLRDITYIIGAVGLIGLILVVMGVVGIVRARRRTARAGGAVDPGDSGAVGVATAPRLEPEFMPYAGSNGDPRRSGAVYGSSYRSEAPDEFAQDEYGRGEFNRDEYGRNEYSRDEFARDRGEPRPAGVYGGGEYRSGGRPSAPYGPTAGGYPGDDYGDDDGYRGGNVYGGYPSAGNGYAERPAGRYTPQEPEYETPGPAYGYEDPDYRGRF